MNRRLQTSGDKTYCMKCYEQNMLIEKREELGGGGGLEIVPRARSTNSSGLADHDGDHARFILAKVYARPRVQEFQSFISPW